MSIDINSKTFGVDVLTLLNKNYSEPILIKKNNNVSLVFQEKGKNNFSKRESIIKIKNLLNTFISFSSFPIPKGNDCLCITKFNRDTIIWLRDLLNKKNEHSGIIDLNPIMKIDNKLLCEIKIKSLVCGDEENVDSILTKASFHTHPKNAYKINNVKVGWPSLSDFLAFGELINLSKSIIHFVVTIEGIYVITLNRGKKFEVKVDDSFKKYYNVLYPNKNDVQITPEEYIKYINRSKNRVFDVQFLSWKESGKIFSFFYPKDLGRC